MAVEVNVTAVLDFMVRIVPILTLGITFGYMLGNVRSEFWDKIFKIENRIFENSTSNLKMFASVSEVLSHCMKNDRFEIVDVTKEGNNESAN